MNFFPRQVSWTGLFLFLVQASLSAQCPTPTNVNLISSSSVTATFSWTGSGPGATAYYWEIGLPGFAPGTNTFIWRDSTTDTIGVAFALVSSTALQVNIQANCNGVLSGWSAPLLFSTSPGCNEAYTDPGGPLNNYANSSSDTVLICPQSDSEVVTLTFLTFETELNGDFLKIYDGLDASAPQIANLSGVYLPLLDTLPGPYTASNASGCLYALFFSNALNTNAGWTAFVSCAPPDSCFPVIDIQLDSLGANAAEVSWTGLFGADLFEWKLGIAPFDSTGIAIDSGTTMIDTLLLDSLKSKTNYVLLVRSQCDSVSFSHWASLAFLTPPACGDTLYDSGGATGNYLPNEDYSTTICPDSANHLVTLTFLSFETQNNEDTLSIYNGKDLSAPLIGAYKGNATPPPAIATNATGCLTVRFVSNGANQKAGWAAQIGCDTATDCYTLIDLNLDYVENDSAAISWISIFGAMGYAWELDTLDFLPGTGAALSSGTVSTDSLNLNGLESGTTYYLYVNTLCGSDSSSWFGPLVFTTLPGCGDTFYDTGGANEDYANNEDKTTVICPDGPNQVVDLSFNEFKTKNGDILILYNGNKADPNLVFDTLSGPTPTLGIYQGTTANGCVTAVFISNDDGTDKGWDADINCTTNPDTCFAVAGLHLDTLYGTTVTLAWASMFDAKDYFWKIGKSPYNYTESAIDSAVTTLDTLTLSAPKLESLTTYDFWIKTNCTADTGNWVKLTFTTSINCNLATNALACDVTKIVNASGPGIWTLNCNDPMHPTPGKETVFQFTAPVTNSFTLKLTNSSTGKYIDYFYKEASSGCVDTGWVCIGDFNQAGDSAMFDLVAGKTYFILCDPEDTASISQSFRVFGCTPPNDKPDGAIWLTVNTPCSDNLFSNENADFDLNEPNPDTSAADGIIGRWIDASATSKHTVWFKFIAPSTGTVTINTDSSSSGSITDTQIALYEAGNSSDYSTYSYIESDEDNGSSGSNGFNAVIYYTGLIPGNTYYIQLDGYGGLTGPFCIEVLDGIARYNTGDCTGDNLLVTGVDGTVPDGDRWYGIYAGQTPVDLGQLVAAIKPGVQNLDTVFCRMYVYGDSIPVSANNVPYMPAYFNFQSTQAPVAPATIRLFFYDYELNALKLKTQQFSNTAGDLHVTQYIGDTINCSPKDNALTDAKLIDTVQAVLSGSTASFYLEFSTKGAQLGEFGAHFGLVALPVELKSFTGVTMPEYNLLKWVTATETNVQWHAVERSIDGVNWAEIGRLPGSERSTVEQPYELADQHPLPKCYYRLRTIDFDGKQQVSNAITLIRKSTRLELVGAFPSPTTDRLSVQFVSPSANEVFIRVLDLNGRIVQEQKYTAAKGLNVQNLDIRECPAGIYVVLVVDSGSTTKPFRIVKQ